MIMYIRYCTAAKKNNSDVIVHTVTKVGTEELKLNKCQICVIYSKAIWILFFEGVINIW